MPRRFPQRMNRLLSDRFPLQRYRSKMVGWGAWGWLVAWDGGQGGKSELERGGQGGAMRRRCDCNDGGAQIWQMYEGAG